MSANKSANPKKRGTLYLIPNVLGNEDVATIPAYVQQLLPQIDVYIVESVRNARRYLVKLGIKKMGKTIDELTFLELDKHQKEQGFSHYLKAAVQGKNIGLLSDAGCPAVADPGAVIVFLAHEKGIPVMPLVGPSSILLALMGSGLGGQNFAFTGYLPIKKPERLKRIAHLEKRALNERQTQLFMEAPYRNNHLFADVLSTCNNNTQLCVAANISLPNQFIKTQSIRQWRKDIPELHKQPTIFVLGK